MKPCTVDAAPSAQLSPRYSSPSPEACSRTPGDRYLFIGQDVDSIAGYVASACCVEPQGLTAYVSLSNVLSPQATFGGLGIDREGQPIRARADWGAGPKNAFESVTRFGVPHLAMGLSIIENDHPGALDELLARAYGAEIEQIAVFSSFVEGMLFLRIGYEFDGRLGG